MAAEGDEVTLDRAGQKLFDDLHDDGDRYALTVMIIEAARTKDSLEQAGSVAARGHRDVGGAGA